MASPLVAGWSPLLATYLAYVITERGRQAARSTSGFRYGQIASASLVSLAHGTNDAQKTMGVITLALISAGVLAHGSGPPLWVIVSAGLAIALGTYLGGWRIIRTMGKGLTEIQSPQGFAAETASTAVILASVPPGLRAVHHPGVLRRRSSAPGSAGGWPRCAGASPAGWCSPGCSRCPPRRRWAACPRRVANSGTSASSSSVAALVASPPASTPSRGRNPVDAKNVNDEPAASVSRRPRRKEAAGDGHQMERARRGGRGQLRRRRGVVVVFSVGVLASGQRRGRRTFAGRNARQRRRRPVLPRVRAIAAYGIYLIVPQFH